MYMLQLAQRERIAAGEDMEAPRTIGGSHASWVKPARPA